MLERRRVWTSFPVVKKKQRWKNARAAASPLPLYSWWCPDRCHREDFLVCGSDGGVLFFLLVRRHGSEFFLFSSFQVAKTLPWWPLVPDGKSDRQRLRGHDKADETQVISLDLP